MEYAYEWLNAKALVGCHNWTIYSITLNKGCRSDAIKRPAITWCLNRGRGLKGSGTPGGCRRQYGIRKCGFALTSPLDRGSSFPAGVVGRPVAILSGPTRDSPHDFEPRTHAVSRFTKNHSIKTLSLPEPISPSRSPQLLPLSHSILRNCELLVMIGPDTRRTAGQLREWILLNKSYLINSVLLFRTIQ